MFLFQKKIACEGCGKKLPEPEARQVDGRMLCPDCAKTAEKSADGTKTAAEAQPAASTGAGSGNRTLVRLTELYMSLQGQANVDAEYGAALLPVLREYKALWREQAGQEAIRACFFRLAEQLLRTILVVPFHYDAGHEFSGDRALHLTRPAATRLTRDSIAYRAQQLSFDDMDKLAWVVEDGEPTSDPSWWDLARFPGSEGYAFAGPVKDVTMYPDTGSDANGTYLLCFTGVDQLRGALGADNGGHIGLFTAQELIALAQSAPKVNGLILNPRTDTHCFIDKRAFQRG